MNRPTTHPDYKDWLLTTEQESVLRQNIVAYSNQLAEAAETSNVKLCMAIIDKLDELSRTWNKHETARFINHDHKN